MELAQLLRQSETEWWILPSGKMRVPVVIYATESLMREMDQKVYEQAVNVATLPGIEKACYVMPDAHWGYGFPIGGVAAFDSDRGGVISAGGVGFDISCGVRALLTGLTREAIPPVKERLAETLYRKVPAGVGSRGKIHLGSQEMDEMLLGGADWAVGRGYGLPEDLERIEERGRMEGARPPIRCRILPRSASKTKWAPWVRAITILKCRKSGRCMTASWPPPSASSRGMSW